MIQNARLVLLDRGSAQERAAIHALIKEHSDGWWHQFTDAWIVGGDRKASQWRDILGPVLARDTESAILVLELPGPGKRSWAFRGSKLRQRTRWLYQSYTGKMPPWERE